MSKAVPKHPRANPSIYQIEPYRAGEGKLAGRSRVIKLASNENPLGASPAARAAYLAEAEKLNIYPDAGHGPLRQAIAARYGIDAARIVCGSGSDEIFQMLARAFLSPGDEIVQSQYAFSIYAIMAKQAGATVRVAAERAFTGDVDAMLAQVTPATKLVFLANPNNPTGTYLPFDEVKRLHAGLPEGAILVLDAAYAEYVRANDYAAGLELAGEAANVLMTRTFSKIHGLAALRLGWGYGAPAIIDALNRVRGPFNVTSAAQAAGIAAIGDSAFVERSVTENAAERARLAAGLTALGLELTPSVCNFLLVHFPETPGRTAADADAALRAAGIIVRAMDGYGLPNALRVSVGLPEENDAALSCLAAFLAS